MKKGTRLTVDEIQRLDFTSQDIIRNPYPALTAMREHAPVVWNESLRSYCITRYADAIDAYHDPRFSSARIRAAAGHDSESISPDLATLIEHIGLWMVFTDPPMHTRLRKLTQSAFSRRALAGLRRDIELITHGLLDDLAGRSHTDFAASVAWPLPAMVIADLLGVPRDHVDRLKDWSDEIATFVLSSRLSADRHARAARALEAMNELFGEIIANRRRHPRDKIIDRLIAAHEDGEQLTEEELVAFCVLLLFAGHETTAHFFSTSLMSLTRASDQLDDFKRHLEDGAYVTNAVNELMRFESPVVAVSRTTSEAFVYRGHRFKRGERVYIFNAAANRDPAAFADPDRLDLRRAGVSRMIGFGYGIHLCLGIHLARMEAEVALPIILKRLRKLQLFRDEVEWTDSIVVRGPLSLRVSFEMER